VIVYAESSAVLPWLLGEPRGSAVQQALATAVFVMTSDLTLSQCDRAFHRALTLGALSADRCAALRTELNRVVEGRVLMRLGDEIVERARGPFPGDPIRTLDALHLATCLHARASVPETTLLTLEDRVRRCVRELGVPVLPPAA
jgi:hypothetical protein